MIPVPGLKDVPEGHVPGAAYETLGVAFDEGVEAQGVEAGVGETDGVQPVEILRPFFVHIHIMA